MPGTADYDVVIRSSIAKPTLSVIVAIYNMGSNGYLSECLASFDAQDCAPGRVEYVLADDCSNDSSLALAVAWATRRDDATVIHLHENMRQGAARNRAIDESRGRWFSIVDADDTVSPDYASSILAAAEDVGADAIVPRWIQHTDERLNPVGQRKRNMQCPEAAGPLDDSKTRAIILRHWQFGVWPRSLFDDPLNRYPEGISYEDTPASTRWLLQLSSVSEARGGCYHYRQNPSSTTHTTHADTRKLEDRLISSVAIIDLAKSLDGGIFEQFKDELEWYFLQVGLFYTLGFAAKGKASKEFVGRVSDATHGLADLPTNPYYRALSAPKRLHARFMWDYPALYCAIRGVVVRNSGLRAFAKRLSGK